MAFKYMDDDRTVEDIVRRSKQSGGGYDSYIQSEFPMFKPREGENTIRVMPRTWTDTEAWGKSWEVPIFLHFGVGPDNGTYLCANKMFGKPCVICEARREAAAEGDEKEADALSPKWRGLCWLIDRANEGAGPLWWAMPLLLFRDINNRSRDKATGAAILIDRPGEPQSKVEGFDVTFHREGSDRRTKYVSVEIERQPSKLCPSSPKRQARWLEYINEHQLPNLLNIYEQDYIEKVLFGAAKKRKGAAADVEDDEEEEDTRSRRKRSEEAEEDEAPKSRRRAKPTPEDDEEDDARSAKRVSDDEDEQPKRGRAKAKIDDDEEVDDEEEDNDDDNEEEEDEEEAEPEDEEADDEAEDDDEEPEEEVSPRRARAARTVTAKEEDDDEEAEKSPPKKRARQAKEDDDDEEAKPAGKVTRRGVSDQAKSALKRLRRSQDD